MSYILEALKKSEQERARESGALPDIKSVHTPASIATNRSNSAGWLFVLIIVVIGISAGVTYYYFASMKPGEQSAATVSTETDNSEQKNAATKTPDSKVASKKAAPELEQPETPSSVAGSSSAKQAQAKTGEQEQRVIFSKEPLKRDDVIGNVAEQAARENIKTLGAGKNSGKQQADNNTSEAVDKDPALLISDIPDDVRRKIPRISFDGHVYSSVPERRSVMINGHKMREGELVGDGLLIREITPEGAEFEYGGYRFKLNALQDWSFN